MSVSFRFLGTGTSVGVPQIGCTCKVCTSDDPRDRRNRCGAFVRAGDVGFLIDTPPEMRLACCRYGVTRVDAVVLTHAHMDHVAGFDDIRRFNTMNGTWVACDPTDDGANGRTSRCLGKVMPCYAMKETEEAMHRIFPYISAKGGEHGLFRPMVEFRNDDAFTIGDVRVERLKVEHGFPCCGYLLTPTPNPQTPAPPNPQTPKPPNPQTSKPPNPQTPQLLPRLHLRLPCAAGRDGREDCGRRDAGSQLSARPRAPDAPEARRRARLH